MFIYNQKRQKRGGKNKTKNKCDEQKSVTIMVSINPAISIIALNVNGLKIPIKRHIVQLKKRTRLNYMLLQETHL